MMATKSSQPRWRRLNAKFAHVIKWSEHKIQVLESDNIRSKKK